ncbi:MAG: hypothetical protein JO316_17160 [Abitibacteriaceae bacterium]|nr:hypothetical protein [Abditibacteriaceae bacterium]MBV9867086.1 hypothetical protein [Abditibacteriaceae bacterium]
MLNRSFVVGLAGGSAAGKSTLAQALADYLTTTTPHRGVEVISTDRYIKQDRTQGPNFISPSTGEPTFHFNHPDALELPRLLADLETRTATDDAPSVLLIEGLMVLHLPPLREKLDLRLFVELDADERALRRLLRDMKGGRASTDPEFIARYYRESARVGHALYVEPSRVYADFIVRGDADFARVVPLLATIIRANPVSSSDATSGKLT